MFLTAILIKNNNIARSFELLPGWFNMEYLTESFCKVRSLILW